MQLNFRGKVFLRRRPYINLKMFLTMKFNGPISYYRLPAT